MNRPDEAPQSKAREAELRIERVMTALLLEADARCNAAELRADVGAALAIEGAEQRVVEACAEAIARHSSASLVRIWCKRHGRTDLNDDEAELELAASAGPRAADDAPETAGAIDAVVRARQIMKRGAVTAFPLAAGDDLLGAMVVLARGPLAADMLAALSAATTTIAQTLRRRNAEKALRDRADELARANADLALLAKLYKAQLGGAADRWTGTSVGERVALPCEVALERALRELRPLLVETGGVVTRDALPIVLGDEGELVVLFLHLIGGAIEQRGTGDPRIHVSAERVGDQWQITVDGNGMATGERKAAIIGFSICEKIVRHHSGKIWLDRAVGGGSRVRFTLPSPGEPFRPSSQ